MDIMQVHEVSKRMPFMEPVTEKIVIDYQAFNQIVESLVDKARTDFAAQGLPVDEVTFVLELDMLYGGLVRTKRVTSPRLILRNEGDGRVVYEAFEREFSEAFSPFSVNRPGGVYLDGFVLKATMRVAKPNPSVFPLNGKNPAKAYSGKRQAYWPKIGRYADTPVYSLDALLPGNTIEGPAIVEAEFTTIVVGTDQRFSIDQYRLGILERTLSK